MLEARRRCLAVGAGSLLVFTFFALQLVFQGPVVLVVDPAVTAWLAEHRVAAVTLLLTVVTALHSTAGIDTMVILIAAYIGLGQRRWPQALWLVAAVETSMLLNVALKDAFARARPVVAVPLVHLSTLSFPSGHALGATALWGCVVCLVPAARRSGAIAAAALLIGLVCLSRVYLGVHFLSDVIAGVCEGLFCASAWCLALSQLRQSAAR